jgi:hypothetical protein
MRLKPFVALLLMLLASCGMPEYVGANSDVPAAAPPVQATDV